MSSSDFVIVIGREYGAGGRRLGRLLSERLSIPYYDKELLSEAAASMGLRADLFEKADEQPPSHFRSLLSASVGCSSWLTTGALQSETLYQFQSEVVSRIVERGSCIIVGRTADYIAREHPGLVSIFLHADMDSRMARVADAERLAPGKELRERLQRCDSTRRHYYNYFTGRDWGNAANYHLCVDTSGLSTPQVANIVEAYLSVRGLGKRLSTESKA